MIQSEIYYTKLTQGQSLNTITLDTNDDNFTYNIHTLIFLGTYASETTVNINGIEMLLSGGFVYNQTPIQTVSVVTSTHGVLVIGRKTRKKLFN